MPIFYQSYSTVFFPNNCSWLEDFLSTVLQPSLGYSNKTYLGMKHQDKGHS